MTEVEIRQPVPLRSVGGVELAALGKWHASTGWITFTPEDFANAVAALECPGVRNPVIKVGHMEEDSTGGIRWDGEPALGWIGNMHVDGAKLIGDYMGMPSWLTEADENGMSVLASAYPDRSIEIYQPFLCQIGHLHPAVVTAVAILGAYAPGVGVLQSMQDVYATYTEPMSGDAKSAASAAMLRTTIPVLLAADGPRDLTDVERRATTDFNAIQTSWQEALDELLAEWPDISAAQRGELTAQIKAAVDDDRTDDLALLAVTTGTAAAALAARMSAVAVAARDEQVAEAARQGIAVDAPAIDEQALIDLAATVTAVMGASTASAAGRTAAQLLGTGDGKTIASLVDEKLTGYGDRFLRDQLGGALSAAQAHGRWSVIDIAPIAEYYASERLDANSCVPCRSIDGERFDNRDDARAAYGSGKYVSCLGGARCRGQLVSVWGDNLSAPDRRVHTTVRLSIGDPMPTKPALAQASVSVEDISRKYYESAGYSMWITAMHVDPLELIASDDATGKFYSVAVTLSGETFTFGEPQEVAINYVPVKSAAAAAIPYRWGDRTAALAAAGVTEPATTPGAGGTTLTLTPPAIAPDVTPAGAAIRKMAATVTAEPEGTTQTPAATPAPDSPDNPEEATNVPFDAAKYREAFGLSAELSDDQVREAALAALSGTPTTPAPAAADIDAMTTLAASGQAVLVDKANLQTLIERAAKGELAYNQNRRNERDAFLKDAVRAGRIPPASLGAYEKLWDNDPEGTRKTVELLAKNVIPVQSVGFLGADATDTNEADAAYEAMYGKGN